MNRDRAADLLIHYMSLAFRRVGLGWDGDNDSEIRQLVDALHGMVLDEIQEHAENAPHIYADGSTS
jgi:hypothetical protein